MRKVIQNLCFNQAISGYTLPKYCLYGNVNNKYYWFDPFTGKADGTYYIHLLKNDRWIYTDTRKHGDIFIAIRDYVRENDISGTKIESCETRAMRAESVRQAKKAEAREKREEAREIKNMTPKMPKSLSYEGGRIRPTNPDWDLVWKESAQNPIPAESGLTSQNMNKFFEMGQNTSGDAGKYTRSGFETRDGLKVRQNKIRPEKKAVKREKLIICINGKTVYAEHN